MRRRYWLSWWFAEEKERKDKVTDSEISGFASKIEIPLGFYWAIVTGLNVINAPGEENVKKPNGIRFRYSKFAKKTMPAFINMPTLINSKQTADIHEDIFST